MSLGLQRCSLCRKQGSSLGCCEACARQLFRAQHYPKGVYLGSYEGQLKRAVRSFKFHGVTRLAEVFARELALELSKTDHTLDLLCPVPLHWTRYLQRGYNQSALIAKALSRRTDIPVETLRRTKRTRQQALLSAAERHSNVADAFVAENVRGRRIALIDDVITTGATMEACEAALLEAGARSVLWLSITAQVGGSS